MTSMPDLDRPPKRWSLYQDGKMVAEGKIPEGTEHSAIEWAQDGDRIIATHHKMLVGLMAQLGTRP